MSHGGGLRRAVTQLHTELPDSDNDGKYLTVDFDIEVNFIFPRFITVNAGAVVVSRWCSAGVVMVSFASTALG